MTFLEAMDAIPAEEAFSHLDNPKATLANLKQWWRSLPEGERLVFAQEVQTHEHGLEFAWMNVHTAFMSRRTPSQWVEDIQSNDWHVSKRLRERRAKN